MSPASYLTAPPRDAAAEYSDLREKQAASRFPPTPAGESLLGPVRSRRMALVWITLTLFLLALIGSAAFATRLGLRLFRDFKKLNREIGLGLDRIDRSTDQIERHLSLAAENGTRLEASLVRLGASRARLNVQRAAIADARAALGRVTRLAPRK